ncbi:MAG: proton glutamate symport protein, partial [Oleiphilaceae bacterium]
MNRLSPWYEPFDNELKHISVLLKNQLWLQIVLALILGISVGLMLSPQGGGLVAADTAKIVAQWVKLPGSVFLSLIQMVVIPLVLSSIMLGIATAGDPEYLKKIGVRIFPYFIVTTTVAVTIGAGLALWIQPGNFIDSAMVTGITSNTTVVAISEQSLPEKIAQLIPTNITQVALEQSMLQLVIYAMIMGVALLALPAKKAKLILQVLDSIQSIAMQVVSWAMLLAPFAVFGLLCEITIKIGLDALLGMSVYVFTVILGLATLL